MISKNLILRYISNEPVLLIFNTTNNCFSEIEVGVMVFIREKQYLITDHLFELHRCRPFKKIQ